MKTPLDVAIIGAGPYGLSLAAHLRDRGIDHCVIGLPMNTWLTQMPRGMELKSAPFASSLDAPGPGYTLGDYCREHGISYVDEGFHVPLDLFSSYGLEFQKRFVPGLIKQVVENVERTSTGFRLTLDRGGTIEARRVVVAVGITHYAHTPPELSGLPPGLASHSSEHHDLEPFRSQEVMIVGSGSSAIDLAALMQEAGARVHLVARRQSIPFPLPPKSYPRPLLERLRHPTTGLGAGWRSVLCCEAPLLFHAMPMDFRHMVVRRHLGPSPTYFIKHRVVGKVEMHLGSRPVRACEDGGRVKLELESPSGVKSEVSADHLIAATGYRVDLERLTFLRPLLRAGMRLERTSPALSTNFESSIPGVYFVGVSAANCFGPLLRFAYGAAFASRRLARHLSSQTKRQGMENPAIPEKDEALLTGAAQRGDRTGT
jgi:thioredoxin reductase